MASRLFHQFIFISALLLLLVKTPVLAQETDTSIRPNVLMICIDDLNDWVGCLGGHPHTQTPHIDTLAKRGRLFTNAHCSVTVCSPSRVSLISGVSPTTSGSYELGPAYQDIDRLNDVPTMHRWFKDHGYTTLTGGKVLHHGFAGRLAKDIDVSFGAKKGGPKPKETMEWGAGSWDWGAYPPTDAEMFDYQNAQATATELRKSYDKPFFFSIGLFRPHVAMFVPPKWYNLFDPEAISLPHATKSDMDDIPANFQYKMGVAPTFTEIKKKKKWRSLVHAYLASTAFVDHCVGEVMKGLDEGPNKDNTIVVLWSDHGFHLGEKQHIAKRTLWEESTRVPLIFAGPGIEPGDCGEPASLLDIYPTLIAACNLPENSHLEGLSLSPQLSDPNSAREQPALSSSYYGNHAVRNRDWRYIRYADGAEELYDHRSDPDEFTNLANHPDHREIKKELAQWIPESGAPEVKPYESQEQVRAGRTSPTP